MRVAGALCAYVPLQHWLARRFLSEPIIGHKHAFYLHNTWTTELPYLSQNAHSEKYRCGPAVGTHGARSGMVGKHITTGGRVQCGAIRCHSKFTHERTVLYILQYENHNSRIPLIQYPQPQKKPTQSRRTCAQPPLYSYPAHGKASLISLLPKDHVLHHQMDTELGRRG